VCSVLQSLASLILSDPYKSIYSVFILVGLAGEEFQENFHLRSFIYILFILSEVHVWFTVRLWLIYTELTALLYTKIRLYLVQAVVAGLFTRRQGSLSW
jgi:hypothetical protein